MNSNSHGPIPGIDWASLLADRPETDRSALQAALALAHEVIQIWDASGNLVLANPASAKIFDHVEAGALTQDQIYGDCLQENGNAYRPDEMPVARVLASGQPVDSQMMMICQTEGKAVWLRINGKPIKDSRGRNLGAVITATDITEFIEHRQRLEYLASYDALTQLPNRLLLAERMRISLARSRRMKDMVAVCMLDLDNFKPVNDNLGHKAGDELLREVAVHLQESIRGDDTVARIGGDEFALLLCGIHKASECEQTLARILSRVSQPYQIAGQVVQIGASAGVALFPGDGTDPDLLLKHADTALYQAKEAGKNRFQFFDRTLDMRLQAHRVLLRKIEKAIRSTEFVLYYQPIVDCRKGQVESIEALIRWRHPVLGLLAPSEFLPLIDQDELSITLGEWVIDEALRQMTAWHADGITLDVSVNISARHIVQPDFSTRLAAKLAELPPEICQRLRIDVAESTVMADINATAEVIRKCHKLGLRVAIDHFGVGYASLLHLKRLIADTLKIDQSFIQNMLDVPEDLAIVGGVVGFASPFGCQVVASGVETIEHLLTLLELGCNLIQGHSLTRPMPPEKLAAWLQAFQPDPLWHLSTSTRPSRNHFELLLAGANLRAWVKHVIELCHQNRYIDAMVDEQQCPFGIWLNKPGSQHFRKYDEYRQIEQHHKAIHQMARRLGAHHREGNIELAKIDEEMLLQEHLDLLSLLKTMRGLLMSHKLRPLPIKAPQETGP
ncbi:MAG: EAL domain-containing protein [Gallionellaceae bacterium]|nr:EAL domain-containing protein [Gallionellaceae bacterium]